MLQVTGNCTCLCLQVMRVSMQLPEHDALKVAQESMAIRVELWRAELATSVIEVDSGGKVVHNDLPPLYPPGEIGQPGHSWIWLFAFIIRYHGCVYQTIHLPVT